MGFKEDYLRAVKETHIHRHRRSRLLTVGYTELPYVLLGASMVNLGDTVVRRGTVRVEKPSIFLLHVPISFEGFEEDGSSGESEAVLAMGRIASFPPGKYSNIDNQLDVFEGSMDQAMAQYQHRLDRLEDIVTGVVSGPVDLWPMSLLVYVGAMVMKSAPTDLQEMLQQQSQFPRNWSTN